ncbi:MAG: hypothetical protein JOY58_05640, partial [Solirubrobacterales bacterium]|nr:hypothetical protein [Solirubrobacterales bacterium]
MPDPAVVGTRRPERIFVLLVLVVGIATSIGVAIAQASTDRASANGLLVVLAVSAVVAGITVVPTIGRASISASFVVVTLAVAFLGPASACACGLLAELAAARKLRTDPLAVAFNVLGVIGPAVGAANLVRALSPHPADTLVFYSAVAAAGVLMLTLNFVIVALHQRVFRDERTLTLSVFWEYTPSLALSIALAVAGAAIYLKVGLRGIVFALVALFAFSYMAHLLEQSRHRAQQYVSLSWGVLAGLLRS